MSRTSTDVLSEIRKRAATVSARIVYPEPEDPRILQAARAIADRGIAKPILAGSRDAISKQAKTLGISLNGIEIAAIDGSGIERFAHALWTDWRAKGVTEIEARNRIQNPLYFAAAMVRNGEADGFVGGVANTTGDTVRAAIHCIGLKDQSSIVSSFFLMVLRDSNLIFADCAVIPFPTAPQLAEIAIDASRNAKIFLTEEPRVAFLSFSSHGSAKHPSIDRIREAVATAKARAPYLLLDGELQLDAAIVPEVSKSKTPGSVIGGKANTLIFPDLQSGNIGYKLVERLAGARAVGPILQGLKKPGNDLSRGCSVDDVIDVTAITVLQAG